MHLVLFNAKLRTIYNLGMITGLFGITKSNSPMKNAGNPAKVIGLFA